MSDVFISEPDIAGRKGFILAEEAALKNHVSGLFVPNPRGEDEMSEVPVWFRWPESERRMAYPFITIDLLSLAPAYERWTSVYDTSRSLVYFEQEDGSDGRFGNYYPGYSYEIPVGEDKTQYIERYLSYNLTFQISTFARSAYHDRFMTSRFITDVFPPRSFWINVEADHVARRCELLQWVSGDTMESGEASKRIFRKMYTVLMETEIPTSKILEYQKIHKVHVDMYDKAVPGREVVGHPVDGPHTKTVDTFTVTDGT